MLRTRTVPPENGSKRGVVYRYLITILDCFFLLRIPLLAPVWTILLLGWITGSADARLGGGWFSQAHSKASVVWLWLTTVGFSLVVAAIYVMNQIADIESDRINGKLFILPRGLVSVRAAYVLGFVCAGVGLAISWNLNGTMTLLFAASLVLGVLYDLPPASLKNHAWGGMIACFLGHGVLTFLVGWYAAKAAVNGLPPGSAAPLDFGVLREGLIPSLSAGFANAAVFVTTTIPDMTGDRAIGKRTFAVSYGERITAAAATIFCSGALAFSFLLEFHRWTMVVPSAISLVLFAMLIASTDRERTFTSFKWPVFLLTATVALFIPVYGVFILATFWGSKLYYRWRFGIDYPTFKAQ